MGGRNQQRGGHTEPGVVARRRGGLLFLLTEAFHSPGGIQNYNRDRVQALRLCRPTDALELLVLNDTPDDVQQSEWRGLHAIGFSRRRGRFAAHSIALALRQQPERILLGHRHLLPLAPLLAAAAPRAALWLLTHGIEVRRPFNWVERAGLRCVQRVLTVSPDTARRVCAAGHAGAVELWPNSLPFSWSLPEPTAPRLERPLRLLTVSRLAPPEREKGIDHTIRALASLVASGQDVQLDIAGEGEDLARLQHIAREEDVAGCVLFHGRTAPDALQRLYGACDVFVLPSAGEGFGIVYLEAMAYARPVVAANAGGAPFVVRPGTSGWLVPYGDPARLAACLAEIVARPDEARRMGLAGRRLLEAEFTFERLVARTARLLEG